MGFLVFLMICSTLLEMIGIGAIPAFVYLISNPDAFFDSFNFLRFLQQFYEQDPAKFFVLTLFFLILIYLVKNIFISLVQLFKTRLSYKQQIKISTRLFKSYISAPWLFHINRNSAEILRNINNETNIVISSVLIPTLNIVMDIILILLTFVLLFVIEPIVSLFTLASFGLGTMLFVYFTNNKLKDFGKEEMLLRKQRNKTVIQTFGALKELVIYDKLEFYLGKYKESAIKTAKAQTYRQIVSFLPKPVLETFAVIVVFIVSLIFIGQGRDLKNLLPLIALFGAAAIKILPAIKQVLLNFTQIRFNHFSIKPIAEDINENEHKYLNKNNDWKKEDISFSNIIEIRDVSFRYKDKHHYVIKNLHELIQKGSFTIISGPSGVGKTTLLNIVAGILQPESGTILCDGKNIYNNIKSWQSIVSYVPQNVFLFDDTIKNNIALGELSQDIKDSLIMESLKAAQLENFISFAPKGLETKIGERGVKISGGQRQRIGIARALYHNPELLILDEATSEIDRETEEKIIKALTKRNSLTVLFVGHKYNNGHNFKEIIIKQTHDYLS